MKKIVCLVVSLIFLALILSLDCLAYSDESTEELAKQAGADKIKSEFLDDQELSGDKAVNIFEKVFLILKKSFSEKGVAVLRSFGSILGILVLCCVLGAMKFGDSATLDSACAYISVLVLSMAVYSVVYDLFVLVIAAMETLTVTMTSFLPITAGLYVMGGTSATGAAASSAMTLFFSILSLVCTKAIMPLLRISFGLGLAGAMPSSVNLSSVTNLVKNSATLILTFLFTLLGFVLVFQTSVASAGDNFVTRSVKFASGAFVPIIGNMLGDASRTVMASVSVIKGTVGGVGVVLVLSAVLPPVLTVVLNKLCLLGCGIIAKTFGCENESRLLYDMCGVLNILLALAIGSGCICILAMGIFIKSGSSL